MKFLQHVDDRFTFLLRPVEKATLEQVLALYPATDTGYHQAHRLEPKGGQNDHHIQALLTDSLDCHREECRRELDRWLAMPDRFVPAGKLFKLALTAEQLEWLLQVLNDVRLGSWIKLGRPNPHVHPQVTITEANARHFWAMETCGMFQSGLLAAFA